MSIQKRVLHSEKQFAHISLNTYSTQQTYHIANWNPIINQNLKMHFLHTAHTIYFCDYFYIHNILKNTLFFQHK